MSDWQNPADYEYTSSLNKQQWAWEFLRRHSSYQDDYQWFITQWQALENDYGKAPDMDYQAWKQDPRSYKIVDLDSEQDGNCAIAQDKLLIECWMGNKWGFFKFPRAPEITALDTDIHWRDLAPEYFYITQEQLGNWPEVLSEPDRKSVFQQAVIDLARPLKEQLNYLKQQLIMAQRRLKKKGRINAYTIAGKAQLWRLCLRFLDARRANVRDEIIIQTLTADSDMSWTLDIIQNEAEFYLLHYLDILTFMEK